MPINSTRPRRWVTPLALAALYAAICALRFAALALTPRSPCVIYDEFLYINAARGLFQGDGVAYFYGQPIAIKSLLYPLIIMPSFKALVSGLTDVLTAVRAINILLSNLAVFPAFAIASRLAGNRRAAWFVAVYTAAIPEMAMSQFAMTENLLLPLTLFAVLAFIKAFGSGSVTIASGDTKQSIATGGLLGSARNGGLGSVVFSCLAAILGVLAYFTKAGYAALPAAMLVTLVACFIRGRNKQSALRLCVFAINAAAAYFLLDAWFLSMQSLPSAGAVDLYQDQIASPRYLQPRDWLTVLLGVTMTGTAFAASIGFVPVLTLIPGGGVQSESTRATWLMLALSIGLVIAGISYTVFLPETAANLLDTQVHLRYLYPLGIPLIALSLSSSPGHERRRRGLPFWITACALVAGTAFTFPPKDYGSVSFHMMPFLALRAFGPLASVWAVRAATTAFIIVLTIYINKRGFTKPIKRAVCGVMLVWALLSSAMEYKELWEVRAQEWMYEDTMEAVEWAKEKPSVLVCDNKSTTSTGVQWVSSLLYEYVPLVQIDRLEPVLIRNGEAVRFIPPRYWREQPANEVAAERLIMDAAAYAMIMPSADVEARTSVNGAYVMIDAPSDRPWLAARTRSVIGDKSLIVYGSSIDIFDMSIIARGVVTVVLTVTSEEKEGYIEVSCGDDTQSRDLAADKQTVEFTFDVPPGADVLRVSMVPLGDVYLDGWEVR